ncbi:TolC family protein [Desulfonema ishimotonii]|uniref:TolC family protein n=1 Tax=Desulfonema ishimotonii TaxID=45657 RepID=A0A401FVR7_9BACT|nr:TolC family protein [Desulfonema ishimotonii]GBC61049.1 TolC family protein [Desulfonema ishimotonii]
MKKKWRFILIGIIMLTGRLVSASDVAEDRLGDHVTLPALIDYAYTSNPSVEAARESWRVTVEKYRITTGYPDPQLMFTWFPEPIETRLGPQDWNASLSQMIPFPGKLTKAGEVVQTEARIAKLNLDKTIRDVSVAIISSYHELRYIQQAGRIAEKNAGLLEQLRQIGETAYARDRAAFMDVVRAQSQTGQLRYDILLLRELEQTEKTRLNGLLNRPPDAPLGELSDVPVLPVLYKPDEICRMAEARQEEIRMADLRVKKAESRIALAKYQGLPDFRVGLFYAGIGDPDVSAPPANAGDDAIGVQFGLTLPLWFGKNSSRTGQAQAEARKARAMKTERINQTRTRIHALFFKLQNARRLIALYRDEMLPRAMQAVTVSETWFREGEGSFSDFTEAQAAAYNFQLSLARAGADYGKALADLEKLAGQRLTLKPDAPAGDEPAGKEAE